MKRIFPLVILSSLYISCSQPVSQPIKTNTVIAMRKPHVIYKEAAVDDTPKIVVDTANKRLSYSVTHFFSDTVYKDDFSITLSGSPITKGIVVFKISDHQHRTLFKEKYASSDLLGDEDDLTPHQQEIKIRQRMADFLKETNFSKPAIDATETFDDSFSYADKSYLADWKDIKADRSAIGFMYCYGYEACQTIAYSKKKKKVAVVSYSD